MRALPGGRRNHDGYHVVELLQHSMPGGRAGNASYDYGEQEPFDMTLTPERVGMNRTRAECRVRLSQNAYLTDSCAGTSAGGLLKMNPGMWERYLRM